MESAKGRREDPVVPTVTGEGDAQDSSSSSSALAASPPASAPPSCSYGHVKRKVGCVSCVLVFDRPKDAPASAPQGDTHDTTNETNDAR